MASLTRGQTFSALETITNTKLHNLVDLGAVSNIVNADISNSAAIVYSKLSLAVSIVNADISTSAAIAYSKLNLSGAVLNADLAGSIADTKLNQITTASKVHGSSITGLASLPSGAGVVPIANLATGTPTGIKFVRDDGTLNSPAFSDIVSAYTAGDYSVHEDNTIYNSSPPNTYTKYTEAIIPKGGTLRIKFFISGGGGAGVFGKIYRNGSAVGTERTVAASSGAHFSEDISGWSAGDLVQLYVHDGNGGNSCDGGALQLFSAVPSPRASTNRATYLGARHYTFSAGVPHASLGVQGDVCSRLDGAATTSFYVKTGASTWTNK